jgi:hypothetical protein
MKGSARRSSDTLKSTRTTSGKLGRKITIAMPNAVRGIQAMRIPKFLRATKPLDEPYGDAG